MKIEVAETGLRAPAVAAGGSFRAGNEAKHFFWKNFKTYSGAEFCGEHDYDT